LHLILSINSNSDLLSQLKVVICDQLRLLWCNPKVSEQLLTLSIFLIFFTIGIKRLLAHLEEATDRLWFFRNFLGRGFYLNLSRLFSFTICFIKKVVQRQILRSLDQELISFELLCAECLWVVSC
jgi:hypothetical protein